MSLMGLLNTAWMARCYREANAFRRATRSVEQTQADLLASILRSNRDTTFGRSHGFAAIGDPRTFQQRVPLSRFEDYDEAIRAIGRGESNVLTADPVELLEPTSGTTGGEKLIPFTRTLRNQFQRAVAAWMYDLFRNRPSIRRGRAYWSISPAMTTNRYTEGGIRIGFDDDADYLGSAERWLLKRLLIVPAEVAQLTDIESFRYCTLWYLLGAADLSLISVWSPTFLLTLVEPLAQWQDRLCFDLKRGWPEPPTPLPTEAMQHYKRKGRSDARRADALRVAFRSNGSLPETLQRVWPRLSLISAWADASAAGYFDELQRLFPHVECQPKGLLATEGCVSFPLLDAHGPVLAVRSHFFEFQEIDAPDRLRLAHEVDDGVRYRVVLTTGGGLYRYELRDEVEVCGFRHECPLLRFVGKSDGVSDLVGEKLAEPHCRSVIERACQRHELRPTFSLLVPIEDTPPRYRLYLQEPSVTMNPSLVAAFVADVEVGLKENPHYAYAVRLGQLATVEVTMLDPQGKSGWNVYERQCLARGMQAGDIKPTALDSWTGWQTVFEASYPTNPGRPQST